MGQFLPINRKEMEERGWQEVDFVYICGDAYVDHPSFGAAIICRTLEANGFKVAFLSQPDWHKVEAVSYTHLDVYKRQILIFIKKKHLLLEVISML